MPVSISLGPQWPSREPQRPLFCLRGGGPHRLRAHRSPCRRADGASLFLDYSKGFGGKYGVDKDKVDKSAVGFEYQGKTEKHESQKGGFNVTLSLAPGMALT